MKIIACQIGVWVFGLMALIGFSTLPNAENIIFSVTKVLIFGSLFCYCFWVLSQNKKAKERAIMEIYAPIFARIKNGDLPIAAPKKAIMREGETCHFVSLGTLLETKTTGYGVAGGSVRVRVAKGVTIGGGGGRGKAIKELVPVSDGEIVLTNLRVVFAGNNKSFETPLPKLTSVEQLIDGMVFHIGSKSHIVKIPNKYEVTIAKATLDMLVKA